MELRNPLLLCFCVLLPLCSSDLSSHFVLEPYDFLFDAAVEAYYKGDWLSVILNMEKALRNKATVRKVKTQCRMSCANQTAFGDQLAGSGGPVPGSGSLADLGFFQKILKRADCVKTCESEKLGSPTLHEVTEDVALEFRKRSPYNYLQVAYFKVNIRGCARNHHRCTADVRYLRCSEPELGRHICTLFICDFIHVGD